MRLTNSPKAARPAVALEHNNVPRLCLYSGRLIYTCYSNIQLPS